MADSRSPSPADPSRDISLHSDPGLQPERTTLAWTRTVVAMLVVGAVMLRWAHLYGSAVMLVAAAYKKEVQEGTFPAEEHTFNS